MIQVSENIYPLPACWHQSWQKHADANDLNNFPTKKFLKEDKVQSRLFCHWIWQQLIGNEGYMCDQPDTKACCTCQRESVSKVISIGVLSLIVRDEDPTLYFVLRRKFRQMTRYERPQRSPKAPIVPDDSPEPHSPLAVNMPVPKYQVVTNAVSRELWENHYWLPAS